MTSVSILINPIQEGFLEHYEQKIKIKFPYQKKISIFEAKICIHLTLILFTLYSFMYCLYMFGEITQYSRFIFTFDTLRIFHTFDRSQTTIKS